MDLTYALLKKVTIGIMGLTLLFIGFILLFIPGPGILTIILGLILLATEFLWARHLVNKYNLRNPKAFIKREEKRVEREVMQEEKRVVKRIKKEF